MPPAIGEDEAVAGLGAAELRRIRSRTSPFPAQQQLLGDASSSFQQQLSGNNSKVYLERPIRSDDTVNKLALEYSVQVTDLKRANNLVADQDLFALPTVKIPMTRYRKEREEERLRDEQRRHAIAVHDVIDLLGPTGSNHDELDDDFDRESSGEPSAEELFEKADASLAAVRTRLDDVAAGEENGGLPPGAFHFVDAGSPDRYTSRGVWMIFGFILLMFLVLPLFFTFVEEQGNQHGAGTHKTTNQTNQHVMI